MNALPILLLGGAALLMMGGKKKALSGTANGVKTSGEGGLSVLKYRVARKSTTFNKYPFNTNNLWIKEHADKGWIIRPLDRYPSYDEAVAAAKAYAVSKRLAPVEGDMVDYIYGTAADPIDENTF